MACGHSPPRYLENPVREVRKGVMDPMEEMIKRIIDMDKKARAITDMARQEKLDSEKDIAEKTRILREEYLERARRRIQINSETERTLAEQKWKKRETYYAGERQRMEATYAAHKDEWVQTIVRRVTEQ